MQVSAQSAVTALPATIAPQDAGQRLAVDAVFAGSLRVSGEQVKVHIELVNTKNGFQVWSGTLQEKRNALAGAEARMSEEIASQVRSALAAKPQ
jgi:TolB-like protein